MLPSIRASLQLGFLCVYFCHLKTAFTDSATTDNYYQILSERPTAENDSPDYILIGTCDRPILDHGEIDEWKQNFTSGEQVEASCNAGFRFQHTKSSVSVLVCQFDGSWVDILGMKDVPKCERIGGCAGLPSVANGFVRYKTDGYMPGSVAPVYCNAGFHLYPRSARPLLTCTNDGQWRPFDELLSLTCTAVEDCDWPTPISDGFFKVISPDGVIVSSDNHARSGTRVAYHCATGYVMAHNGSTVLTCLDGEWIGEQPVCRQRLASDRCPYPPAVGNARAFLDNGSYIYDVETTFSHDTGVIYICDYGFYQQGSSRVTCISGEWIGQGPKCLSEDMYCLAPPPLLHGDFSLVGREVGQSSVSGQKYPTGVRAFYYCNNGFRLTDVNFSVLTCSDGKWKGNFTQCVRRTSCDQPMDIENGNWIIQSLYSDFRIGVTVSYECEDGFKAVGATEITCQASGYWSDYGPRCLPLDLYCAEPQPVVHGFYMCKPSHCDSFRVGTEVHHVCRKNYEPNPSSSLVQTCLPGGQWSGEKPICIRMSDVTTDSYSLNTNSFIVVISTACGVLGLMLAIMAAVLLKRRFKPNSRLCPPAPGPPSSHSGYSSQHLDDQDREALIPHVDFSPSSSSIPPILPTYEEAIMNPRSSASSSSQSSSPWVTSTRHRDFLRSFPTSSRTTGAVTPFVRDQTTMSDSSQHRNSITTMASGMTRADNGSIAFGSIDTVNVSDATSTSVTVDTCDSISSNPSIAMSHRATAGSIDSASANEVTSGDATGFLDRRDHETMATGSDVSSLERYHGDASAGGRSCHSCESTPILELPEEGGKEEEE